MCGQRRVPLFIARGRMRTEGDIEAGGTAAGGSVHGGSSRRVKATPVQVTGRLGRTARWLPLRHSNSTPRHQDRLGRHAGIPGLPSGSWPSRPPQVPGLGFPLLLSGHHGHHPFCPVRPQHLGLQRAPPFCAGSCGRAGRGLGLPCRQAGAGAASEL